MCQNLYDLHLFFYLSCPHFSTNICSRWSFHVIVERCIPVHNKLEITCRRLSLTPSIKQSYRTFSFFALFTTYKFFSLASLVFFNFSSSLINGMSFSIYHKFGLFQIREENKSFFHINHKINILYNSNLFNALFLQNIYHKIRHQIFLLVHNTFLLKFLRFLTSEMFKYRPIPIPNLIKVL